MSRILIATGDLRGRTMYPEEALARVDMDQETTEFVEGLGLTRNNDRGDFYLTHFAARPKSVGASSTERLTSKHFARAMAEKGMIPAGLIEKLTILKLHPELLVSGRVYPMIGIRSDCAVDPKIVVVEIGKNSEVRLVVRHCKKSVNNTDWEDEVNRTFFPAMRFV